MEHSRVSTGSHRVRWPAPSLLLLLCIVLAFLVRVYGLAAQSLWNDEGTSVALARLSLPAIISGAAHDIHPPLYYLLLHFWVAVAGDTEFALRFLSLVAGVLLVAITARLGREWFGPRVAVLAGLVSALASFQVYYSQETRMYIWVTLWGAVSFWGLARFLHAARRGKLAAGALAGSALALEVALYSHYFAPTLILAQGLAVLGWLALNWRARPLRALLVWLGSQGLVALAFLPWLGYAGNQLASWPAISEQLGLPELAWRVLSAFVLGLDAPVGPQIILVAFFGLLFLAGLWPARKPTFPFRPPPSVLAPDRIWPIVLCACWALIPLGFMYAVSLQRPAYNPKFLLLATPGFYLLAARGLDVLLRGSAQSREVKALTFLNAPFALGCALALLAGVLGLQGVYMDPRLQRDDYRGVMDYINRAAGERDAVVVDAPGQIDVVRYYYRGAAPLFTLPVGRPLDGAATQGVLNTLLLNHHNIFAVYWATEQADPEQVIEKELGRSLFQATDEWHGNIRLAQYGDASGGKHMLTDTPVAFGDGIVLEWSTRFGSEPYGVGRVVSLHFAWRALARPVADYKVFVHLLDRQGHIVSQRDAEPVNGQRPTRSWSEGESVGDNLGLLIRPGTPPGEYTLEMGLYRPENGARLPVASGGDYLLLGTLTVGR